MHTYKKLIGFAKPYQKFLTVFLILTLFATVFGVLNITLLIPLLDVIFGNVKVAADIVRPEFSFNISYLKELFEYYFYSIIASRGRYDALIFVCCIILVFVLISNAFRYMAVRVMVSFKLRTALNIRTNVYNKLTDLHIGYFNNKKRGDLITRIFTDAIELENTLTNSLSVFIKEPLKIIGFLVVLFALSFKLTLIVLMIVPIAALMISSISKKLRHDAKQGQQSFANMISIVDETIGGIRIIFGFNAIAYMRRKFLNENLLYNSKIKSLTNKTELASPFSEFLGICVTVVILLYGGYLVLNEESVLKASEFITYIILMSQVLNPSKSMATSMTAIQKGIVSGERLLEILEEPDLIKDCPNPKTIGGINDEIKFENVKFSYDAEDVLGGINFKVKKGQSIALVGPSGGGKSTIADLMCRFYDPKSGSITIDGIDLRDISIENLRSQMGIVSQESILFNDTIFNNIAFGMDNATLEQVQEAARIANAEEFIVTMENGYYSVIGERGMKLSGGQRQRLSIARAVLKNPPILVLDEATSALDATSESLVQDALYKLMTNRTSIVIAHRLATIKHSDKIIVIDKGQIVEHGTHQELIQKSGMYKKLSKNQFE